MRIHVRRSRLVGVAGIAGVAGLILASLGSGRAGAAEAPVGLGTAASYAVLAGTTVTNTGASTVHGDLGVSPGSAVTGFPPGIVSGGTIHTADAAAGTAEGDVTTVYNDAASRSTTSAISADLGGQTLTAGVYTSGSGVGITGTLTLDGQNNPDAVWVFQAVSTLITATSSHITLTNGAQPCNVFWKVGSSATLGVSSTFVGVVLALTSITADTNASIDGRLFARNGAVTLDSNSFTQSVCNVGGTSGVSGVSGVSGPTGVSGVTGPTGVSGSTGVTGPTGVSGTSGVSGVSGVSGTTGQVGGSGISGGGGVPPVTGGNSSGIVPVAILAILVGGAMVIGVGWSRRHPTNR